jgi:hypothetical protein
MPSWNELIREIDSQPNDQARSIWLNNYQTRALNEISRLRAGRNVMFYASAFLSKPDLPPMNLQITHEEINGLMSVMHGMQWDKGLTLILHTPGGITNAAETMVAYLHSKFTDIEVIVPTIAMSAGTMIALSSNNIVMGRQSQLGPIDPQIPMGGRTVSARAIVDQFERARTEIKDDRSAAILWAPILQSLGPALLQEAQNALDYGESMVSKWLEQRMFAKVPNPKQLADQTAAHFNHASLHKSHGRRIDRNEARANSVVVEDLEPNQDLQEWVLTSYHLMTILFEKSPSSKVLISNQNKVWVKNANVMRVPNGRIPVAQMIRAIERNP